MALFDNLSHIASVGPGFPKYVVLRRGACLSNKAGGGKRRAGCRASALPQDPEESARVARAAFGFAWPWAALWLSNRQMPVGDVPGKRTKDEWRQQLSPLAAKVLVDRGTEMAFSSPYDKLFSSGTYSCAACEAPLFSSEAKFNSGTGWPSFYEEIPNQVDLTLQLMYCVGDFGARECRCHNCGGHLGHMFTDGPEPTGNRYCINGVALKFDDAK
mmetsp:Transcript_31373/g.43530  ORF Transcript_31373/g.43530 Transcript_31373/m.43530 type:complete len:215 (+) Transcript_31373:101-745(+)|eukprot:CAMPEP_0196593572 /NCGR_PEP_ID=MMETSP1081-20130531/75998_1 /TAXON_ID=36882 /ORGANISM="Pyramimonas amylifera, Strain CCMP720" /LENGTH=214 /DNA_ID=CAMNT_0041917591 /DNA_START=19 /DNA_END=663 /DNA_ORIENTATION=+